MLNIWAEDGVAGSGSWAGWVIIRKCELAGRKMLFGLLRFD